MSHGDYLKHCQADVIFVMFGYNEAYRGPEGLEEFTTHLDQLIEEYRALRPNGTHAPRFVLFSPIAHENLNDPNLPDGSRNNQNLALYSEAVGKIAQAKTIAYVDLFSASQALYERSQEPLTLNGVHLNELGNRLIGEVIASQLLGQEVSFSDNLEPLRNAVVDKNFHWFNRFRATDGNDVWGGRSSLKFVNEQTNFEVLQHELVMLDIMTANRDRHIWGLARGRPIAIDDSNVPPPVEVISNVGGGSRSSSAQKEGSLKYLSGQEGIAKMTIPDGFAVNLFADEEMFPELVNPVQMAVDTQGRLWVAAWKTYPKWEPLKKMDDRILILPDEDHDGVADRAITLAGALPGDALILTKPLGSGVLMAAEMAGLARGADVAGALEWMQQAQGAAAAILGGAHAMTDVTGFGLAGHLDGICQASGLGAELSLDDIPVMDGAVDLAVRGVRSTIFSENRALTPDLPEGGLADLLFDPQTGGGLLAAVEATRADDLLSDLHQAGYRAAVIGRMVDGPPRITLAG